MKFDYLIAFDLDELPFREVYNGSLGIDLANIYSVFWIPQQLILSNELRRRHRTLSELPSF